jgi:hypothetical protein
MPDHRGSIELSCFVGEGAATPTDRNAAFLVKHLPAEMFAWANLLPTSGTGDGY